MKNSLKFFICISLFIIMTYSSCKKCCYDPNNPECENYDPCYEYRGTKFDFFVSDRDIDIVDMGYDTLYLLQDTSQVLATGEYYLYPMDIYFNTSHPNPDSVKWKIGTNTNTYRQKRVALYFKSAPGTIQVMHIIYDHKSIGCNGNTDGVDTIIKQITILPNKKYPIFGKYHGYNISNPADTFTIEIGLMNTYNVYNNAIEDYDNAIFYLPKDKPNGSRIACRNYSIWGSESCWAPFYYTIPQDNNYQLNLEYPMGTYNKIENKITIDYTEWYATPMGAIKTKHTFIGNKIQ